MGEGEDRRAQRGVDASTEEVKTVGAVGEEGRRQGGVKTAAQSERQASESVAHAPSGEMNEPDDGDSPPVASRTNHLQGHAWHQLL